MPDALSVRLSTSWLTLKTPPGFHFWRTVYSHGWCDLPPFAHNAEKQELFRVLRLADGTIVITVMTGAPRAVRIRVQSQRPLTAEHKRDILHHLAACLRLDEDFSDFHRAARAYPQYRWIARSGSGRLLRAPTVFEDVVKMICTTNCTWALTKLMVTNLVEHFGESVGSSHRAFPTPEAIAASSERYLRKEIKAGYRSPYLLELAERVASGTLDLESWRSSPLATKDLFKQMLLVKGIGPYAAGNLMKLVGHYDYLGLDSWVRSRYSKLHRNGRPVKDATIEKHYAQFGKWRGLFFWLEMTRYWHDEKFAF
jgi:N-glycosylase/DNA lyase